MGVGRWQQAEKVGEFHEGMEVRIKLGVTESYQYGIVTHKNFKRIIIELGITKQEYVDEKERNPPFRLYRFANSRGQLSVGSFRVGKSLAIVDLSCVQFYYDEDEQRKLKDESRRKKGSKLSQRPSVAGIEFKENDSSDDEFI